MKTSNAIWWVVGVVIVGLLGWELTRILNRSPILPTETSTTATTTIATSTTPTGTKSSSGTTGKTTTTTHSTPLKTYTNVPYSFSISFPQTLNPETFAVFHMLNNNDWRVGATPAKRGTPIISIPVVRLDNEVTGKKSYPLFFDTEVRIGASTDTAQCYAVDDGYTSQTITNVTINGVTWKKFIFGDAATMKYISGASYRTIHDKKCYVVEQIRLGSIYRDPTMTETYSDKQLDAFYAETTPIVMSFRFQK